MEKRDFLFTRKKISLYSPPDLWASGGGGTDRHNLPLGSPLKVNRVCIQLNLEVCEVDIIFRTLKILT